MWTPVSQMITYIFFSFCFFNDYKCKNPYRYIFDSKTWQFLSGSNLQCLPSPYEFWMEKQLEEQYKINIIFNGLYKRYNLVFYSVK